RNLLAQVEELIEVSINDFDSNPRVINCKNGVVNLRDKSFSNHSPKQFNLNRTNASYDPNATCHRWIRFLEETFQGNKEQIDWIQLALGYSILGLTTEHCFFICYGEGRN